MKKRILIIDDDEELCEELREIFQGEGFEVVVAHSGNSGRELLQQSLYQLVILDLKLPGMRGSEVLKLIKGREPEQKVIVLSAKPFGHDLASDSSHNDEDEMVFHTADAVINKPVKVETLIAKVFQITSV